ncbi:YibE/F [Bacillaceae bacterium SAS-127]|nr:YibE/F [Bacillaceae bacterium SAS-127]
MNVLVLLTIILFILMVLIGGKKGVRSFFSLFLNFGVVFLTILFMLDPQSNTVIVTLVACVMISCINLFYINEVNGQTITAFISTLLTIIILLSFIHIVTEYTMIQGFGEEEIEELSIFSFYVGVDFVKIAAAVIIMSAIGAMMDVAISITTSMHEIYHHNPLLGKKDLFRSGLSVGRDILGTDTNTLFFAFFGSYLGLLIWFKDLSYSFGEVINSKVFSAEMITILCSGIGIALVIPIAAWMSAYSLTRNKEKSQHM